MDGRMAEWQTFDESSSLYGNNSGYLLANGTQLKQSGAKNVLCQVQKNQINCKITNGTDCCVCSTCTVCA